MVEAERLKKACMLKESHDERIGGSAFHMDCAVWAAISYLDSPTDYRESLFHTDSEPHVSELEMLDKRVNLLLVGAVTATIIAVLASIFLLFLAQVWD